VEARPRNGGGENIVNTNSMAALGDEVSENFLVAGSFFLDSKQKVN
jgi:hypothetical protein